MKNDMNSSRSRIFAVFLILLMFSFFIVPFMATTTFKTLASDSEPVSMPMVSRIGLDGPKPQNSQYNAFDAIGTYSLVIILVEFTDKTHYFSASEVGTNAITALGNYYDEVSYGLIDVAGDTTNWLTLGQNREYYVDGTSYPSDPKFDLVEEAITLADPVVDYSLYDGVSIIHAGQGQELSHDWRDYWSSEWFDFTLTTNEGPIHRASVSPELSTPGQHSYVGVIAHEFGHDLGLPDLYDVDYSGEEFVGHWGLMAKGSWNGPLNVGDQPSHIMGWCKTELGWIQSSQIVEVATELSVVIDPLELPTSGIHLVRVNLTSQQYFLIEVRKKIGYDASLPGLGAGSEGVLLTYVDETLASGQGIVKVIDSHPATLTKDDGAFGIGLGEVNSYISTSGQFSMVIEEAIGNSYNISIIRAFMAFVTPQDGSAFLSPDLTLNWTGSAAGGIDHFELFIDGSLSYNGPDTNHSVSGLAAGLHNATLVMVLSGTGRRLKIQSLFVIDLEPPTILSVSHFPDVPAFGDRVFVTIQATDDTWISNATVFFRRRTDTRWYNVEMTHQSGSEWQASLGTFILFDQVTYFVSVTDAGGRTVSDDNAGVNYTFSVMGIGLTIWLIIAAVILLILVIYLCTRIQRRRKKPKTQTTFSGTPSQSFEPSKPNYSQPGSSTTELVVTCPNCGATLTPNSIYCGYCGHMVEY